MELKRAIEIVEEKYCHKMGCPGDECPVNLVLKAARSWHELLKQRGSVKRKHEGVHFEDCCPSCDELV